MSLCGIHRPGPAQTVIYGMPVEAALGEALDGARRIAIVTNSSLSNNGALLERIEAASGGRCVAPIAGVGFDALPRIAREAMHDRWVRTNPRPFSGSDELLALLETAW